VRNDTDSGTGCDVNCSNSRFDPTARGRAEEYYERQGRYDKRSRERQSDDVTPSPSREMLLSSEHVLLRFEHFAINYSTRIAAVKQLTLA